MVQVTLDLVRLLRQARLDEASVYRRRARSFRRFVVEAVATSPFHRERCREAGLTPSDLRTPEDLTSLPLMERTDLVERVHEVASTARLADERRELRTSGSSGVPLRVWIGPRERGVRHALQLRARWLAGRRPLQREAIIGSNVETSRPRPRRGLRRSLYLSALDPPHAIAAALRAFVPQYLVAFPSTLLEFGEEPGFRPALITTGAEVLEPGTRRVLERRFGAPVRDIYGAVETGLLAFQCFVGAGYHLNDDEVYFEWLPIDESPGLCELVVTPLFARATPLVRYRLSDVVRRLPGRCPCGSWLPRVASIEGRRDDWLVRPDGQRVPPAAIRALFRHGDKLVPYRVTQGADGGIELELGDAPRGVSSLVAALSEIVGQQVNVAVRSPLPRDPSGKRRAIRRLAADTPVSSL